MSFYRPFGYSQKFLDSTLSVQGPAGAKGADGDNGFLVGRTTNLFSAGWTLTPAQISPYSVINFNAVALGQTISNQWFDVVATNCALPSVSDIMTEYSDLVVGDAWEFTFQNWNDTTSVQTSGEGGKAFSGKVQLTFDASWETDNDELYIAPKCSATFKCVITSQTTAKIYHMNPTTKEGKVKRGSGILSAQIDDEVDGTLIRVYNRTTGAKLYEVISNNTQQNFLVSDSVPCQVIFQALGKAPSFRLIGGV